MRIIHKIGDTFKYSCIFSDDTGLGIDITDFGIRLQAKKDEFSDVSLVSLSVGSGVTVTDAVNGEYEIEVLDTTAWEIGLYNVDIEYTDAAGVISSTETFEIEVIQDVTR